MTILPHNRFYNLFVVRDLFLKLSIFGLHADILPLVLIGQFLLGVHFFKHMLIVIRLSGFSFVNLGPLRLGVFIFSLARHTSRLHLSFILSCKLLSKVLDHLTIRILIRLKLVADLQINGGCELS